MVKFSEFYKWLAHTAKSRPAGGYTSGQVPQKVRHSRYWFTRHTPHTQVPTSKSEQYVNVRKIGEGTFGDVFLCDHYSGEKLIKKVPKVQPKETRSQFKQRMEEVLLEAKMLQAYKHPNIVRYVDSYWEEMKGMQAIIIITEFCTGGDLRGFMKKCAERGGCPREHVADIFLQVRFFKTALLYPSRHTTQTCLAIEYLHRGRLLHRDLKPDNVFLTGRKDKPTIKIGDFGLVKQMDAQQNTAMTMCGTMLYMAPEILKGEGYGTPNDVWALGCILYELSLCNGSLAFRNVADVVNAKLPTGIPSWCQPTITSILKMEPKARPTTSDLVRAFSRKK